MFGTHSAKQYTFLHLIYANLNIFVYVIVIKQNQSEVGNIDFEI